MSEVLQTNIFFYITSIAVILVTIVVIILLVYIISILNNFKRLSATLSRQVEAISKDLDAARANIKKEGEKIFSLWNLVAGKFSSKKSKKGAKK